MHECSRCHITIPVEKIFIISARTICILCMMELAEKALKDEETRCFQG